MIPDELLNDWILKAAGYRWVSQILADCIYEIKRLNSEVAHYKNMVEVYRKALKDLGEDK